MAEGLPDEFAELAVVVRGAVADFNAAMEDMQDTIDETRRKAERAGRSIEDALGLGRARRGVRATKSELEDLGDEISQVVAQAEALDGKEIDVSVDLDKDSFSGGAAATGGGGMSELDEEAEKTADSYKKNRSGSRSVSREWARLQDELFAVVQIFKAMPPQVKVFLGALATAAVSFATVGAAAGGLAAAATGLASVIGNQGIRSSLFRLRQEFVALGKEFTDAFTPLIRRVIIPAGRRLANELRDTIPELRDLARRQLPELARAIPRLVDPILEFVRTMEQVTDAFQVLSLAGPRLVQELRQGFSNIDFTALLGDNQLGQGLNSILGLSDDVSIPAGGAVQDVASMLGIGGTTEILGDMTVTDILKELNISRVLGVKEPDQDIMEAFREAVIDFLQSSGFGGQEVSFPGVGTIQVPEREDNAGLGRPTPGERLSATASQRLQEARRVLQMADDLRGANIITIPEATESRLNELRSVLEELLKIRARTDGGGAVENALDEFGLRNIGSIEGLQNRIRTLQRQQVREQFSFDRSGLQNSLRGVINKGRKIEKRAVQFVRKFRELPSVTLETEKQVRSLLQNLGLAPDRIDRIIKRLRGMTPVLQKVQEAFKGFLRQIGEGFAKAFTDLIFSAFERGKSELEKARQKLSKIQLKQQLADARSRLASGDLTSLEFRATQQRIKVLRKELQKANKTVSAIGGAFRSMAQVAKQALQQLIQKLIVAIGKALILKALNAASGISGASSIVGAIGQLIGSIGGGGGSGPSSNSLGPGNFPTSPGGPTTASRTGRTAQLRGNNVIIPVETIGNAVNLGNSNQRRTGRT